MSSSVFCPVRAETGMTRCVTRLLRLSRLLRASGRSILLATMAWGLFERPDSYWSSSWCKCWSCVHGSGVDRSNTKRRKRQRSMCRRKAMPSPRLRWAPRMRPGMSATTCRKMEGYELSIRNVHFYATNSSIKMHTYNGVKQVLIFCRTWISLSVNSKLQLLFYLEC